MTGRDPLTEWTDDDCPYIGVSWPDYCSGANDRLDALRPLIDAANALAHAVLAVEDERLIRSDLARQVRDLTTPKGDTP